MEVVEGPNAAARRLSERPQPALEPSRHQPGEAELQGGKLNNNSDEGKEEERGVQINKSGSVVV